MKGTELRFGNIVMDEYADGTLYQVQVSIGQMEYPHNCQPIPLTEEWLKRFGFVKSKELVDNRTCLSQGGDNGFDKSMQFIGVKYEIFVREGHFYFIIDEFWDDYGANYVSKEIKHVHELQNLYFALTGEELKKKSNERNLERYRWI